MNYRYRYIASGLARFSDPISQFALLSANQLNGIHTHSVIRVKIPDGVPLYKDGEYSECPDSRTLEDLGCDILVRINGHYKVRNDLKHLSLSEIGDWLSNNGYFITFNGYTDKIGYKKWMKQLEEKYIERHNYAVEMKTKMEENPAYISCLTSDPATLQEIIRLYVSEKTGKFVL